MERGTYSDIPVNFERHPINKDLMRVVDEVAVSKAIRAIIMTNKGEVPYQPYKGGNVKHYLFENMTPQTAEDIKTDIEQSLADQETRAQTVQVRVVPHYGDNAYVVTVAYTLVNDSTVRTVNISLKRVN